MEEVFLGRVTNAVLNTCNFFSGLSATYASLYGHNGSDFDDFFPVQNCFDSLSFRYQIIGKFYFVSCNNESEFDDK